MRFASAENNRKFLKLKKVHRVLKFHQKPWIKPYIELNTSLRQNASCKAEEALPKLMNNSFFGKTCEDVKRYRDVQFICGENKVKKVQKQQNSPRFQRVKLYSEYSGVVEMHPKEVLMDKPRYVGMCILAISKEVMYDYHYNFIMPNFPGTKLGFTDTDSFMYAIPCEENIYSRLLELDPNGEWMDFSNYPEDHPNYSRVNHLIPGKFKDEGAGSPYSEGYFLRAKMYHIENVEEQLNKSTAKGIPTRVKEKELKKNQYRDALFHPSNTANTRLAMPRIVQDSHQVYTVTQYKSGLSSFNDKVWIDRVNDDEWVSHSFGYYRLK